MPQLMPALRLKEKNTPRKIGAYDTEGVADATAWNAAINYFKNTTAFANTLDETKTYGRDHNLFDNNGRMSDKESLYVFGISAKVDAISDTLDSVNGPAFFNAVRQIWGISHIEISFVRNELGVFQFRDIPVQMAVPVEFHEDTNTDKVLVRIDREGMLNLTISAGGGPRMPYLIGPNEQFEVKQVATLATLPSTATAMETYVTIKFEGIRAIEDN